MKYVLISLLILGIACAACAEVNFINGSNNLNSTMGCIILIDNTTNTSYTINYVSQVFVPPKYNATISVYPEQNITHSETNITCSGNSVKQNSHLSLLPTTSLTDPVSNNTYTCEATYFGLLNTTIQQGTSYFEPSRNVSVSCQPYTYSCMQNITYNATYNETYNNTATNITVQCPKYPTLNLNMTLAPNETYTNGPLNLSVWTNISMNRNMSLTYGENYTNDTFNFTVRAPPYPKLNISVDIVNGTKYYNADLNLTCNALGASCNQNVVTFVGVDGKYTNAVCGITVAGPSSDSLAINEVIQAEWGQDKKSSKYGITCRGPPKFQDAYNLTSTNNQFRFDPANLVVNCWYNETLVPACSSQPINYTAVARLTASDPNCTKKEVCLDPFQNIMTKEEAFNGDVAGACGRVINESINQYSKCQADLAKKDEEIDAWKDPFKTYQASRGEDLNLFLLALFIILCLTAGIVYYFFHEKKSRSAEKIHAPKSPLSKSIDDYSKERDEHV